MSRFLIANINLLRFASLITVKGEYPLTDSPRVGVQRAGAVTFVLGYHFNKLRPSADVSGFSTTSDLKLGENLSESAPSPDNSVRDRSLRRTVQKRE